jgi:hypothetical protein
LKIYMLRPGRGGLHSATFFLTRSGGSSVRSYQTMWRVGGARLKSRPHFKCGNPTTTTKRQLWLKLFPEGQQSRISWWFRHLLRIVPIGFITFTVYKTGYAMGLSDYAMDPVRMDRELMDGVVGGRIDIDPKASPYLGKETQGTCRQCVLCSSVFLKLVGRFRA